MEACKLGDVMEALKKQEIGDNRLVGQILIEMGRITEAQLEEALAAQAAGDVRIP